MFLNTPQDLGNIVRDRRTDLGLTQSELAERIGRARQWVVRFESGHAGSANIESVLALLDELGLYSTVKPFDDEATAMSTTTVEAQNASTL